MSMSYAEAQEQMKQDPKRGMGMGFCGFVYAATILGFFCNNFVTQNEMADLGAECCAIQVSGSS